MGGDVRSVAICRRLCVVALTSLWALALSGCGGSAGSSGNGGQVLVGLSDAAGDFLSYTVDVVSLTLTKADGTVVSTLPLKTRVDFTQVADVTEFFTGATIPAGRYTSIGMRLDYSNADIEVDDGNGNAVPATVKDHNGNPITTLDVAVKLDTSQPLVVAPGVLAHLELDFNLAVSNSVTLSPPVVTVDPVLSATLAMDNTRQHRVRGPLTAVDLGAGTFTVSLRPFNLLQGGFGSVTVATDANTVFEVNETDYQGGAGLAALNGMPSGTAVVALVTPNSSKQLIASEVYAGSSVAFGTSDVVRGVVVGRDSNNLLTVRGSDLVRSDGSEAFHNTIYVQLGPDTKVTGEALTGTPLDLNSVSVGQVIQAFGTWNAATTTLDATDPGKGPVRLLLTQLNGQAKALGGSTVTMTLDRIEGRPINLFSFAGTGSTGQDADPANYVVSAPGLLSGITAGAPLKVRGFVRPFGQATPADDFDARTVINVSTGPADLVVGWPIAGQPSAVIPFSTYLPSGMVLDLSHAGRVHDVYQSGVDTVLPTTATPTVNAQDPNRGVYAISYHGTVQVYSTLSDFQSALQARLGQGQLARAFSAEGTYAGTTSTLTAEGMFMLLE